MACSRCLEETLEWQPVSGRGRVYSFSIVDRPLAAGFPSPSIVAIVELTEGPRMLTDLVGVEPRDCHIGMPVHVSFEDAGTLALYHFAPIPV
jgi:uncharacterized OB-fold protein